MPLFILPFGFLVIFKEFPVNFLTTIHARKNGVAGIIHKNSNEDDPAGGVSEAGSQVVQQQEQEKCHMIMHQNCHHHKRKSKTYTIRAAASTSSIGV